MKIGVYGSSSTDNSNGLQLAKELGREIARQGHIVVTGACGGFPLDAMLGAREFDGHTIGYSPASNRDEHVNIYKNPTEGIKEFVFVPEDYIHRGNKAVCTKYRNVSSTADVDCAIIVGGRIGTMHEFTSMFDFGKNIGILKGTGGITERAIQILLDDSKKDSGSKIIYNEDPVKLVQELISISN